MSRLALQVYDNPGGTMLADWSGIARGISFETGEHGFANLTADVPLTIAEIFEFYNQRGAPYVLLGDGAAVAYEGRLEDTGVQNEGLRLTALGYWRALSDVPYTALWSSTKTDIWQILTVDNVSAAIPDRYEMSNDQMLYIAPRKDENFSSSTALGMYGLAIPDDSERQIVTMTFDYELTASSSWRATVTRRNSSWASLSSEWTLDGDGSTQSGSGSLSFTACDALALTLFYNTTAADYTGETGDTYVKLTNVRVKTTTSSALYADEIAAALAAYVNGVNSTMISDDDFLLEEPTVDLDNELYLDARPADILDRLKIIGDDQSPPKRYEAGVWEDRRLHFREKGSQARTWYVDLAQLNLERSLDKLINSAYTVYNGGDTRTAVADNDESQETYGLVRRGFISTDTEDSTLATTYRDALLEDSEDIGRASIDVNIIYDGQGARVPLWMVRAGDRVMIRNLPPNVGELDGIRRFIISRTRYDVDNDLLTLTPAELPSLELLVARSNQ